MSLRVCHIRRNPRHRAPKRRRLDGRPCGAAQYAARALRAARVVDQGRAFVADDAIVPPPRLGIPWLAGRAEHEKRGTIVAARWLVARAHESADGRR